MSEMTDDKKNRKTDCGNEVRPFGIRDICSGISEMTSALFLPAII